MLELHDFPKRTAENHLTKKLRRQGEYLESLYIKGVLTRREAKEILKGVWIETIIDEYEFQREIRKGEL